MKLIGCFGDLHCGHRAGLTPPRYQLSDDPKARALQKETWNWFRKSVQGKKYDLALINGDLIDGDGRKSGGIELSTTDRIKQAEMAAEAIATIKAERYILTYGTAYHTGDAEDFESVVVSILREKTGRPVSITGTSFFEVEGVVFMAKHHAGGGQAPVSGYSALRNEAIWQALWAEQARQPKARIILRSHVHVHRFVGDTQRLAMTLPALQAAATKFGRRCSGTVDFGFVEFTCHNGGFSWDAKLLRPTVEAAKVLRI